MTHISFWNTAPNGLLSPKNLPKTSQKMASRMHSTYVHCHLFSTKFCVKYPPVFHVFRLLVNHGCSLSRQVCSEIEEIVKTGIWVGDCFIYTNSGMVSVSSEWFSFKRNLTLQKVAGYFSSFTHWRWNPSRKFLSNSKPTQLLRRRRNCNDCPFGQVRK